jgi:hypothetical protein
LMPQIFTRTMRLQKKRKSRLSSQKSFGAEEILAALGMTWLRRCS